MIGIVALPALIYSVIVIRIPESPRWLILNQKDDQAGLAILEMIYAPAQAKESFNDIKKDVITSTKVDTFFSKKYKFPILLAFLLAFSINYQALISYCIMPQKFSKWQD